MMTECLRAIKVTIFELTFIALDQLLIPFDVDVNKLPEVEGTPKLGSA